jgi:hypothetical protein
MNIVLNYFRQSILGDPPRDIDDVYCPRFASDLDCLEIVTIYSWRWLQEEIRRNADLGWIVAKARHHYRGRAAYCYLLSQVNEPGVVFDSTDTIWRYGQGAN